MAKIDLPKRSGKRSKVWEKSVKSQGILKTILSGNPACNSFLTVVLLILDSCVKTVLIQIRWLLMKPSDQNLHCF